MFPKNGPVAANGVVRNYIATAGLTAFPEEYRPTFQNMLSMPVYEMASSGTEMLYAAVMQLSELPQRLDALMALGELAQAVAIAGTDGKADRWWAIHNWVLSELADPGVENPNSPAPEVDQSYSLVSQGSIDPPPGFTPPAP